MAAIKPQRLAAIRAALDDVRARCDVDRRRAADPVSIVHRFHEPLERELVAVMASSLAFGNVKAFYAKIEDALDRLGPGLPAVAEDRALVERRLKGWKHRVYRDRDLGALLLGARRVQLDHGSLGAAFAGFFDASSGDLRAALTAFVDAIRAAGPFAKGKAGRGAAHILADPSKGSASKRLMLLLRWMIRPDDGVDFGAWQTPTLGPRHLLVPVDTHVHKLARNLGMTSRPDVSWRTAEEITAVLASFDAEDPVKYDFSLCHLGMLQRCPSRRDAERCEGCGVKAVCRHWTRSGRS